MSKIVITENSLNKKVIIKEKMKEPSEEYEKLVKEANRNIEEAKRREAKTYIKAKTFIAR